MTAARREEQRRDLEAFADDLRSWLRGEVTERADAAGQNLAELLLLWRKSMTESKKKR